MITRETQTIGPRRNIRAKRVLFVFNSNEHLGVTWLSATLKAAGHDVRLAFDPQPFRGEPLVRIEPLVRLLDCTDHIVKTAKEFDPDVICYSCYTDNFRWMLATASAIKRALPRTVNVFGGVHVLAAPEATMSYPQVDAVVLGESFEALPELVAAVEMGHVPPGIPNVWSRDGNEIVRNSIRPYFDDLDCLPIRDFTLFYDQVPAMETNYLTMTSLGCPQSCSFCSVEMYNRTYAEIGDRRRVRRRSVEHVMAELRAVKARGRVRQVSFMDAIFTLNRNWLEDFLDAYREEIGLPFWAYTYPGLVNRELAEGLAGAGCRMITMGVQSGSRKIRRSSMNRSETGDRIQGTADTLRSAGIQLAVDKIIGSPGETAADRKQDIELFRSLHPDRLLTFPLSYYPGTSLVPQGVDAGIFTEEEASRLEHGDLSPQPTRGPMIEAPLAYRAQRILLAMIPLPGGHRRSLDRWVWRLAHLPGSEMVERFLVALNALRIGDTKFTYLVRLTIAQMWMSIHRRIRPGAGRPDPRRNASQVSDSIDLRREVESIAGNPPSDTMTRTSG
ncbi:MAG: hypothetical protein CME06_10050 [Gemmatimonadetes bacterium]|nr:hypothetical protein [Gemmatimonadota bacterium]